MPGSGTLRRQPLVTVTAWAAGAASAVELACVGGSTASVAARAVTRPVARWAARRAGRDVMGSSGSYGGVR